MKRFVVFLYFGLVFWFGLSMPGGVFAASAVCPPGSTCLDNPLEGNVTDAPTLIGNVIKYALGIVGAVTLLMFIRGAQMWLMSAGNSEKVEAGAKTMLWATIGVFLVFASYIILTQLISLITGSK